MVVRMTRQLPDLAGKVVVITGGTGGIGGATAREVLARGARVAILDINPEAPRIAEAMSAACAMGVVADVSSREAMNDAMAAVVDRFGRIDVAIANAGILTPAATLRRTPEAAIEAAFAVNVTGVINTVHAAMDHLIAQRGQIVLISSVFAFLNGMGVIPYAMTKSAVEALGRGLRVELAPHGVTTTTAYFSLIDTNMIRDGVDSDPVVGQLLDALPAPFRLRLPPEIAAEALADGIANRSVRVVVPARWKLISALRGLINPLLDARLARDHDTLDVIAQLDEPRRSARNPR